MANRFYCFLICSMGCLAATTSTQSQASTLAERSQSIPQDMLRLLHKDTPLFIYIEAPDALYYSLMQLYPGEESSRAAATAHLNPNVLLKQLVITKNKIITDEPIALGYFDLRPLDDFDGSGVCIFQVENASPKTVKAKSKDTRLMFLEGTDWIAVTNASASWTPQAANAPPPPVTRNMLPGQCVMSFDQASVLESVSREKIDEGLKKSLDTSSSEFVQKKTLDAQRALLYGFKRWDLSMAAQDGDLTLSARYEPTADSWFKFAGTSGLVPLSHHLPQMAFQCVLSAAPISSMLHWIQPVIIAQAGKDKQMAARLLTDLSTLVSSQQGGSGMAFGLSEYGVELVQISEVKDVAASFGLIDTYISDLNTAKAGLHLKRIPVEHEVDTSRLYELTFEKKEMKKANPLIRGLVDSSLLTVFKSADEEVHLQIFSKDKWIAAIAGSPKSLKTLRREVIQPPVVWQTRIGQIASSSGGNLIGAMSLDLRKLLNEALQYIQANPEEIKREFSSVTARRIMSQFEPIPGAPAMVSGSVASQDDGAVMLRLVCEIHQIAELYSKVVMKFFDAAEKIEEAEEAQEVKKAKDAKEAKKSGKNKQSGKK